MCVTAMWVTTCFDRPTTGAKEACDDDDSHGWWEAEENAEVDRHANESVCTPQWMPEAKAAAAASAARLSKTTCAQVKTKIDCMAKEMMAVLCSYNFCSAVAPSRAEWAGEALSTATDGLVEALTEAASKCICEEGGRLPAPKD